MAQKKATSTFKPVGRPRTGKRSDPAYAQFSVWLGRELHKRVRIQMLVEGYKGDFSELVSGLLAGWLAKREGVRK